MSAIIRNYFSYPWVESGSAVTIEKMSRRRGARARMTEPNKAGLTDNALIIDNLP